MEDEKSLLSNDVCKLCIFTEKLALISQYYKDIREIIGSEIDIIINASKLQACVDDSKVIIHPDKKSIKAQISLKKKVIVISTYASCSKLLKLQDTFDTVYFDEAHNMVGKKYKRKNKKRDVVKLLDDKYFKASYRLFLTATTAGYKGEVSMHNTELFGPMLKHITNREMVEKGWLTNYQLVNLFSEENAKKENHIMASLKYCFDNISSKKITVYSSTCKDAKKLYTLAKKVLEKVNIFYIDGSTPEHEREEIFEMFRDIKYRKERCVLFNVGVVKTGVDLKLLDSIMFADPKTSCIDIIQIIGRMQRPDFENGENLKEVANLVIPCVEGDYTTIRAVYEALAHNDLLTLSKNKNTESRADKLDKVIGELLEQVKYVGVRLRKNGKSKAIKTAKKEIAKILKSIVCQITGSGISTPMVDKLNILLNLAKEVSNGDGFFKREDFFKRVEEYGFENLKGFGGKTPTNTLSGHLTDKLVKKYKAVEMVKRGSGKYRILRETV